LRKSHDAAVVRAVNYYLDIAVHRVSNSGGVCWGIDGCGGAMDVTDAYVRVFPVNVQGKGVFPGLSIDYQRENKGVIPGRVGENRRIDWVRVKGKERARAAFCICITRNNAFRVIKFIWYPCGFARIPWKFLRGGHT